MNIARLLFSGLLATALVVGCGSDASTGGETATKFPLAGCATGSTTNAECQACYENRCKAELKECYGTDYAGGACKKLSECSKDAEDPCNASCNPDGEC